MRRSPLITPKALAHDSRGVSLAAPPVVSLLQGIIRTARISKNSVIVVCARHIGVHSWPMWLIITFMFEPAKLQMR